MATAASQPQASLRHDDPPGPRGMELFSVLQDWRGNGLMALERLAAKYGDIACAKIFGKRIYLFSHPDLIHHVLIQNRENYLKKRGNRIGNMYFGDAMQLNNGDKAKQLRRVMAPAFQQSRVTVDYCDTIVEGARAAAAGWTPGPRPSFTTDLMEMAGAIAVRIHFGTAPGEETDRLVDLFRPPLFQMNAFHPPRWVPSSANRSYDRAIHELNVEVLRRIRERRASGPTGTDLLSLFVNAVGDNGRVLSDDEMRNELLSMMAAGYQNIGIAIIQTLRQVALAPAVDEALYAEVSRVLDGRPARADDLARLPYSDQIVKESLRCAPPAGAIMRRVAADDTLRNWRIAANSEVFISAWVMHRDARYYDNPLQFKPERWTPEFERGVPPCAYLPFGRGARACIAGAMATVLIRLMMVTIAQTWRIRPVEEQAAGARPFDRGGEVPLMLSPR